MNKRKRHSNIEFLLAALFFFFLILFIGCSQVAAPAGPEGTPNPLYEEQDTAPTSPADPFNILVIPSSDAIATLNQWQWGAILSAAAQWEGIITQGFPNVEEIDDLAILIRIGTSQQYLAEAFYSLSHRRDNGLPYFGYIDIHPPLLDATYTKADWERAMVHEIAHVLGFDWLLFSQQGLVEKDGDLWYFTGKKAIGAYRDILYRMGEKLSYAIADLRVPLYSDGAHWHNNAMAWELLSPSYSSRAALSAVTLSAMADIGYTVDMSQAESVLMDMAKIAPTFRFRCDGKKMWATPNCVAHTPQKRTHGRVK